MTPITETLNLIQRELTPDLEPAAEAPAPQCGQCRHFQPERSLTYLEGSHQIHAPSYCRLKASVSLSCLVGDFDPACIWFVLAIPF